MSMKPSLGLTAHALCELARHDLVNSLAGFQGVCRGVRKLEAENREPSPELEAAVLAAVNLAIALYWKPVRCLQRSAVTARLLRKRRADAQVVIGYRPAPFFSHAWVEVDGRAVNDSTAYQRRLLPLARI